MLIEFRFGNYMSFRDETSFDMRKSRVTEYPHHIVDCGTDKVLKTSAIYGANGSGKTNIYRAFQAMREYVNQSLNFDGNSESIIPIMNFYLMPFVFDKESLEKDIMFEVFFYHPDNKYDYNYGFSLDYKKRIIKEEWLNCKAKTRREYRQVFYRTFEKQPEFLSKDISEDQQKIISNALNKETLLISLGAKLKIHICEMVYQWFAHIYFLDFGNPFTSASLSRKAPQKFLENDPKEVEGMVQFISTFDTSIKGFKSERINKNQPSNTNGEFTIFAQHQMNNSGDGVFLPFDLESAGTQKMLCLYDPIQKVLRNGGILVIDEMNDRLHPLLQRNLIQTFLNPESNPKNAQLIFTTHDITLIATNLLRRDEIWIVKKDSRENASELYSITDFKNDMDNCVRKEDCLWKRFLMGEYGGVPDLEKITIDTIVEKDAE